MKKTLGLLLALTMVVAACGDDDGGGGVGNSTDPATASSCDELADVTINLLQEAIDSVSDLSVADFMDIAATGEMPPAVERLDTMGNDLEARAGQLGCDDADAQRLVCARIDQLEANSEVADLILAGIAGEC
jgi:hypothetical protein